MKSISYISVFSMLSIIVALLYVIGNDIYEIRHPSIDDKERKFFDLSGVPLFFGTALFMFEGNGVAIEIYYQMEEGSKKFRHALGAALTATVTLILTIGVLSYLAYAQYTQPIIIMNLTGKQSAHIVQTFYALGIIGSYTI